MNFYSKHKSEVNAAALMYEALARIVVPLQERGFSREVARTTAMNAVKAVLDGPGAMKIDLTAFGLVSKALRKAGIDVDDQAEQERVFAWAQKEIEDVLNRAFAGDSTDELQLQR